MLETGYNVYIAARVSMQPVIYSLKSIQQKRFEEHRFERSQTAGVA